MKRLFSFLFFLIPFSAQAADTFVSVGQTSVKIPIFVSDSSSSTGAGLTGLAFNSASLVCYYFREAVGATATSITLATSTLGTYTSGCFKEVSSTNMPGWYEFCPPDAAFVSGAGFVAFQCKGATNMAQTNLRVQLGLPNNLITNTTLAYMGQLTSESTVTYGVNRTDGSDPVTANNQGVGRALIVYSNADPGLELARCCVSSSSAAGNTFTCSTDISALITGAGGSADFWSLADTTACAIATGGVSVSVPTTVATGTAQSGAAKSITLAAGASSTASVYKYNWITITSGTGAGQTRRITGYNGSTKVATVNRVWNVTPDGTSVYAITAQDITSSNLEPIN